MTPLPGRPFMNPAGVVPFPVGVAEIRDATGVTTSGMVSQDSSGKVVGEGDVGVQTRQVLENIKSALDSVGASLEDVVKTTIFLSDMIHYQGMNAVFNEYFEELTNRSISNMRSFCLNV